MPGSDWLDELDQIRRTDETQQKEKQLDIDLSVLGNREKAVSALRISEAHKLLRRVQSVLLSGKGTIDIFDSTKQYERAIALVWQGSVSNARTPDPDDPEDYKYIMVGASGTTLYVNGKKLDSITPEALQKALVWAAKNPKVKSRDKVKENKKK
jgi:hypothetical protein